MSKPLSGPSGIPPRITIEGKDGNTTPVEARQLTPFLAGLVNRFVFAARQKTDGLPVAGAVLAMPNGSLHYSKNNGLEGITIKIGVDHPTENPTPQPPPKPVYPDYCVVDFIVTGSAAWLYYYQFGAVALHITPDPDTDMTEAVEVFTSPSSHDRDYSYYTRDIGKTPVIEVAQAPVDGDTLVANHVSSLKIDFTPFGPAPANIQVDIYMIAGYNIGDPVRGPIIGYVSHQTDETVTYEAGPYDNIGDVPAHYFSDPDWWVNDPGYMTTFAAHDVSSMPAEGSTVAFSGGISGQVGATVSNVQHHAWTTRQVLVGGVFKTEVDDQADIYDVAPIYQMVDPAPEFAPQTGDIAFAFYDAGTQFVVKLETLWALANNPTTPPNRRQLSGKTFAAVASTHVSISNMYDPTRREAMRIGRLTVDRATRSVDFTPV